MSILDMEIRENRTTKSRRIARRIRSAAPSLFQQLLSTWAQSVRDLWQGETAEILAEFGTDGAEIFRVSSETAAFLEKLKPGCTAEARALMRPFTVSRDGTVTLDA